MSEMVALLKEELREEYSRRRAAAGKRDRRDVNEGPKKCFICDKVGHIARQCYKRNNVEEETGEGRNNNKKFTYLGSSKGQSSSNYSSRIKKAKLGSTMEEVIGKFPRVFNDTEDEIEYKTGEKCTIYTKLGAKVVKRGQCVPQSLKTSMTEYFKSLQARKIIRRSESAWRNPIRALEKPDGGVRLVSNLMALDDLVEKDPYVLPTVREVIRATEGSRWFTVIDLKEGFYHIEIEEKHKHKTAFEFDGRVYEWNSMVMGFKNAPQIMQRTLKKVLDDLRGRGVEIYMDDVVVHAKDSKGHDILLERVLSRFEEYVLRVNSKKIQYRVKEVTLLGVTVDEKSIKPLAVKRNEALLYKTLENVKELRRFLGLVVWFREFIPRFSIITERLTDALRKDKKWNCDEEKQMKFEKVKEVLREARELKIPNYDRPFRLRTDACDTGIGAILLQEDKEGSWCPIQWASKKLTPTERRYGISEKEMLAVFWGIKKFEYELRGRKFHLMTDHKALERIRDKPYFSNNRINRWVEKIQEFDFTIEYVKGEEMVDADALSRQHEASEENDPHLLKIRRCKEELVKKQQEGKKIKHVKEKDGKKFWEFSSGVIMEVPEGKDRDRLIRETHEQTNHRGMKGTYYEMKKRWYWPGMKDHMYKVLKGCETCGMINRKTKGGCDFVKTSRKLEKMGLDILTDEKEGTYCLIGIDYFTRKVWGQVLKKKASTEVCKTLEQWCRKDGIPEEIVSANGKEFTSAEFEHWCHDTGVRHRKVGIESHTSNGRVERAIRTIREGVLKTGGTGIVESLADVIDRYNGAYHSGIKCTPNEAWTDGNKDEVVVQNREIGEYAEKFKRRNREVFIKGQKVRIASKDNLGTDTKACRGRFFRQGTIAEVCDNDSYIVREEDGRLFKKRHYDLKGMPDHG